VVVAAALASMLGVEPVRRAELLLVPLMAPLDALLAPAMPEPGPQDAEPGEDLAAAAWDAWLGEVRRRPAPTAGTELATLSVLAHDDGRGQLVLRAGDAPLWAGDPVTHRGALVGFLAPASRDSAEATRSDGTARVSLLGERGCRPVAGELLPADGRPPVRFLVAAGDDGPELSRPSSVLPTDGRPMAFTRDVTALGDRVPADLLLGRLETLPVEHPGGGLAPRDMGPAVLSPVLSPDALSLVTVETSPDWEPTIEPVRARALATSTTARSLVIDRGRHDGVNEGDLVVQDGRLVGTVVRAGLLASEVARAVPEGPLLVELTDGLVLPVDPVRDPWPGDPAEAAGRTVFLGTLDAGGLLAGHVTGVGPAGAAIALPAIDLRREVVVRPR
jgi:hypothetical protein